MIYEAVAYKWKLYQKAAVGVLHGQTNLFCGSEVLATKQETEMSAQNDDGDMWNVFATKGAHEKQKSTEKAAPANTCKINGFKWRS